MSSMMVKVMLLAVVMHVGLDGCLVAVGVNANVVVPADSGVPINKTLLDLVGLLRCQNQFSCIVDLRITPP